MCVNLTNDYWLRLTNDRPDLSSESSPNKIQDNNVQIHTFQRKTASGHKFQSGLDTMTYWLTDCQSQNNFDFDFDFGSHKTNVSFQHILINLTSFMGTTNYDLYENIVQYFPPHWIRGFLGVWIADVLSHFPPIFSSASNEWKKSD
jgi:hypothetical protein